MNSRPAIIVISVLLVAALATGGLYWQSKTQYADSQAKLSTLKTDLATEQTSLTTLTATISQVGGASSLLGDFTAIVTTITPEVVRIDDAGPGLRGFASGVIISKSGYVLTVDHNVNGATSIQVTLSTGDAFPATIVKEDVNLDVAVLKITSSRTDFPAATLGTLSSLSVGQEVVAAGFPLGSTDLPGMVSYSGGIISALRPDSTVNYTYIQSNADINPGSGGGGLFTLDGKMVGIPSLGIADGICESIPVDVALPLIQSATGGQ